MAFKKIDPEFFSDCPPLRERTRLTLVCECIGFAREQGKPVLQVMRLQDQRGMPCYDLTCGDCIAEGRVPVCDHCLLKGDPSLRQIPELQEGQVARRNNAASLWVVDAKAPRAR